jgi:sortase (surface protein transpeptidase)
MTPNSRLAIFVKANTLVKITLGMVKNIGVKENVYLMKLKQRYEKQHLNERTVKAGETQRPLIVVNAKATVVE